MSSVYESIVEGSNDGIFLVRDDEIVCVNERLLELTGYSRSELIGTARTKLVVADDEPLIEARKNARTNHRGAPSQYEVDLESKNGDRIPVEVSLSQLEYEDDTAFVSFCRDITERKEREQELKHARKRSRELFENAPDGMVIHDDDGEIIDTNRQTVDHLEYDREELLSMNVTDYHVGGSRRYWNQMKVGETRKIEREHERNDGSIIPVEIRVSKIVIRGKPRFLALTRDITDRKRQERYLEKAQEIGDVGWWRKKIPSDQIYWSEQVYDMWGVEKESGLLTHERFLEFIHPDDVTRIERAWDAALGGEPYDVEHRIITADGETRWMRQQAEIVFEDGEPVSATGVVRDITVQKQRETELSRLRYQFEQFSENVQDAFFLLSADYSETLYVNSAVERIYGIATEDAYGDPEAWLRHVHPEDEDELLATIDELRAGTNEGSLNQQCRIQHPERGMRWIQARIDVVTDGDGTVTQIAGIATDVTERKEREQKLRQFRKAVEATAHAVYITEPDGTIQYVNPTFEEITGHGKDEAIGRTPRILHSGEHNLDHYATFWETIGSGEQWEDEMIDERADGEQIILNQTVSPITDEDGVPQKFVAVAQDITQRKEYEGALEDARAELRKIIDLVPDLLFAKNREGEYLLANEATAEAYGLTPNELEGKMESDVLPDAGDAEEFREDDIDVIESGESKEIPEEELTTIDGEKRILQTTKIPYEVPGTGEDAVLGYARDVTELKAYEQQLETQRNNLEVLNQVVRHDIRNDLQLVLGYTDVLKEYVKEDGEGYVANVLEAARDAVDITTTARDVTEVMLQSTADCHPVRLRSALEDEVNEVRSKQEHAVVTIDGAVPKLTVLADDMLNSVFRNLLNNAIQHNDTKAPAVTASARREDDSVLVQIADNGPGIPDERKENIFEQGEMGLGSEGTGVGLYLVDTLVERYGGDIRVEDNVPEGAVFILELPIVE